MFEQKLKEKYFEACGVYGLAKHTEAGYEKIAYAAGYKAALEWAMEEYEGLFDPPMSDEDFLNSQAAGLVRLGE